MAENQEARDLDGTAPPESDVSDAPVLFPETTRIREAMMIINNLEAGKLSVVLGRLAKSVGAKGSIASVFDESERDQLQEHLHLSSGDLDTLLGACSFILEQSAYHLVKPINLFAELKVIGMGETQVPRFSLFAGALYWCDTEHISDHWFFGYHSIAGTIVCKCMGAGGKNRSQV